jgi:hypothetical protein
MLLFCGQTSTKFEDSSSVLLNKTLLISISIYLILWMLSERSSFTQGSPSCTRSDWFIYCCGPQQSPLDQLTVCSTSLTRRRLTKNQYGKLEGLQTCRHFHMWLSFSLSFAGKVSWRTATTTILINTLALGPYLFF